MNKMRYALMCAEEQASSKACHQQKQLPTQHVVITSLNGLNTSQLQRLFLELLRDKLFSFLDV